MKKVLLLLLILSLLVGTLAGCGGEEESTSGTSTETGETETEQTGSTLPEMDWGNRALNVTSITISRIPNIILNEDMTDPIGFEVYARNAYLEEKYHFVIECDTSASKPSESVRKEAASGESTFDLVLDTVTNMKGALADFVFTDLAELPYIDWNAPGWDQEGNNDLDIMGYRFVCTGDANLYEKGASAILYYNRPMLEASTTQNIRQIALDGDWSMELMKELVKNATVIDAAGTSTYGLVHSNNNSFFNYMQTGYGLRLIVRDEVENTIRFSFDDPSSVEKTLAGIDDLLLMYADRTTTYNQRYSTTTPKAKDIFMNGQALFWSNDLSEIKSLKEQDFSYGVLPFPKSDPETQEKYYAARFYGTSTLFAIPYFAKDLDFSAFALQAIMENSDTLTHIYVENQCKIRGSVDEVDYQLMTLAIENSIYDLGAIFNWGAVYTWIFQDRYDDASGIQSIPVSGTNNFTTVWASDKVLAHLELNEFLAKFQ